ncbi:hypothetical protein FLK61_31770 [Paenalkalicoccus suaedae]|uniref:DUF4367 domain-containing protein n=1 Tax=Paenalkalicoccus suaedae TaxID=2592382 RepID=A0A859FDK9_9BACI|nr:hypothetical protein [Paenalkalicoccus suaedae]QKS71289.1 hypothetical protein FLK61_31770 [Paenalkalicoccus suaedae]
MQLRTVLVAGTILLVGCGENDPDEVNAPANESEGNATETTSASAEITAIAEEQVGISPYIPEHEEYSIHYASVGSNREVDGNEVDYADERTDIDVFYGSGDPEAVDQELTDTWEERNGREIVYGDLTEDDQPISIMITAGGAVESSDAELVEISGAEVNQLVIPSGENEIVTMSYDAGDYGYFVHHIVDDENSIEDAEAFMSDIIDNQ